MGIPRHENRRDLEGLSKGSVTARQEKKRLRGNQRTARLGVRTSKHTVRNACLQGLQGGS